MLNTILFILYGHTFIIFIYESEAIWNVTDIFFILFITMIQYNYTQDTTIFFECECVAKDMK